TVQAVLVLTIKRARNVQNFELLGKSDPFVKAKVGPSPAQRTAVRFNTTNPIFGETLTFRLADCADACNVKVELMLFDKGTIVDELVGYTMFMFR
ncbi:unnamed protein product, partial [Phaeothamnion confervicola]